MPLAAEAFQPVVPPVAQLALAAGGTARALRRVVDTLDADGLTEAVAELSKLKRAKIAKRFGVSAAGGDAARRSDPLRRGAAPARPAVRARRRRRARGIGARARSLRPRTPSAGRSRRSSTSTAARTSSTGRALLALSPTSASTRSPWTQATAGAGEETEELERGGLAGSLGELVDWLERSSLASARGSTDSTQRAYGLDRIRLKSRSASCATSASACCCPR